LLKKNANVFHTLALLNELANDIFSDMFYYIV